MKKILRTACVVVGFLVLLFVSNMPSTNSPVEVSKEAYEYLTRGDWYSWGETDVLNADGVFVSKPRDRIVFGKYYMEEYRVDLDTGEYELLTRQNYRAKIKASMQNSV